MSAGTLSSVGKSTVRVNVLFCSVCAVVGMHLMESCSDVPACLLCLLALRAWHVCREFVFSRYVGLASVVVFASFVLLLACMVWIET